MAIVLKIPVITSIDVVTRKTFQCNRLWATDIHIRAAIPGDLDHVTVDAAGVPYAVDEAGTVLGVGTDTIQLHTKNLVAAIANLPSFGAVYTAVENGLEDWWSYQNDRLADLAAAQAEVGRKSDSVQVARRDLDAARAALAAPDPSADLTTLQGVVEAAIETLNSALTSLNVANDIVMKAQFAWSDPASPPVSQNA